MKSSDAIYYASRTPHAGGPAEVTVLDPGGEGVYLLPPRNDLFNHSPDGFQFGYSGSGPAQLALALLADATGIDSLAVTYHQDFKRRVIAPITADTWTMTRAEVLRALDYLRVEEYDREQGIGAISDPAAAAEEQQALEEAGVPELARILGLSDTEQAVFATLVDGGRTEAEARAEVIYLRELPSVEDPQLAPKLMPFPPEQQRVRQLEARVEALEQALATQRAAQGGLLAMGGALAERLGSLEQMLGEVDGEGAAQSQRVERLERLL